MSSLTACKVVNKGKEAETEELKICTEWSSLELKILIIRSDHTFLVGEARFEDFLKYANTFEKTLETYLQETKNILSGVEDDIEFVLKDNKFCWKRKKWYLGQIDVKAETEPTRVTNFILLFVDNYSNMKKHTLEIEKENSNLKNVYSKLSNKLNDCCKVKEKMEKELYAKFILVINSKKAKLREFKSKQEKYEKCSDSAFDAITDESENELDVESNYSSHSNILKKTAGKRSITDTINNNPDAKKQKFEKLEKTEVQVNTTVITKERSIETTKTEIESYASTSKYATLTSNLGEDEETPDFLSGESECEVELKFEEDKIADDITPDKKDKISAIVEEDSEEEIF